MTATRTKEVSILNADLITERDARRGLQEKNTALVQSVNYMVGFLVTYHAYMSLLTKFLEAGAVRACFN